jgi:septin family protein
MQDLKDVTNDLHYENFRSKYIQTIKKSISSS